MKDIQVKRFGTVITDKEVGNAILYEIKDFLAKDSQVNVNLSGVITMATYCAKQIFGSLYLSMGSEQFFKKIVISNANDDIKTLIQLGIINALENRE